MDDASLNAARRVIRRANFRLKAEEYEAAFALFIKGLEFLPESTEIMNILGDISIKMGNIENGIRYYRDSSVIEEDINTQIELGFALLLNNQLEEAHEIFTELDSNDSEVKAGLGISLILLNKDLRKAGALLTSADRYDLGINISTFLGLASFQLGQYNKAASEFRKNFASWENVHAIGVQYLAMKALSTSQNSFRDALIKYENEVGKNNVDTTILNKLNFDLILSEPNPQLRFGLLKDHVDQGIENLEVYLALIATMFEISAYDPPIAEYIKKAKVYVGKDETALNDQLNAWLDRAKERGL